MTSRRPQQFGFSLIEAMVALLVIAVGLLGIAGMQAWSLSETHNARLQSIASIEASNMATYISTNASFWTTQALGHTASVTAGSPPTITATGLASGSSCLNITCTDAQIANANLKEWGSSSELGLLPQGRGTITCGTQGTSTTCTIVVGWTSQQLANTTTAQGLASSATYQLVVMP